MIACTGQFSAHNPQCRQCSCRIMYGVPSSIHCCGQFCAHSPHPIHPSVIRKPFSCTRSSPREKLSRLIGSTPRSKNSICPLSTQNGSRIYLLSPGYTPFITGFSSKIRSIHFFWSSSLLAFPDRRTIWNLRFIPVTAAFPFSVSCR